MAAVPLRPALPLVGDPFVVGEAGWRRARRLDLLLEALVLFSVLTSLGGDADPFRGGGVLVGGGRGPCALLGLTGASLAS